MGIAVFGQVDWAHQLTRSTLSLGARYTDEV